MVIQINLRMLLVWNASLSSHKCNLFELRRIQFEIWLNFSDFQSICSHSPKPCHSKTLHEVIGNLQNLRAEQLFEDGERKTEPKNYWKILKLFGIRKSLGLIEYMRGKTEGQLRVYADLNKNIVELNPYVNIK